MAVDFGRIFSKALAYPLGFKRMLPFFAINAVLFSFVLLSIDSIYNFLLYADELAAMTAAAKLSLGGFVSAVFIFILLAFCFFIINLFLLGAVTDNAVLSYGKKDKPLSASFDKVKKRYFSILGATILVSLISMVLSTVPAIGGLINLIVSIIFMFIIQSVIISGKGALDSLQDSYAFCVKNKLNVILFWLITVVIGFFIFFVALMPAAIALIPAFISGTDRYTLLLFVKNNIGTFFACSMVFSVAAAYLSVFQEAARTFFYLSARKK